MDKFEFNWQWLEQIAPEGIKIPSSTLISGEGGSGKPLIGFTMISSWLEKGGDVIFVLTSTGIDFAENIFKRVYNLDLDKYKEQIRFIELDVNMKPEDTPTDFKSWRTPSKANLVNPENWDLAIEKAEKEFRKGNDPGTMVFGAALNLMLFSKTYGEAILSKFKSMIQDDKKRTYLFTVSTSALADKIKILEDASDNLMFTRNEEPMKLFLTISRIKDLQFDEGEVEVPLSKDDLETIKELAEGSRSNLIPAISKI